MTTDQDLQPFRQDVRQWLKDNFPASLTGYEMPMEDEPDPSIAKDLDLWRQCLADKGWGVPTWPEQYGGAGLSHPHANAIADEIFEMGAFNPIPILAGMGATMVGPTILEYGTEEQKRKHLPKIASGEIRWCLGLSEPNAGSDLASLSTKAVDAGDHFVLNGQKIWTSGADRSQWCGALVRSDPDAGKRNGISFILISMEQPGVETRPIRLISGASPFCETFFNDARAEKMDLLGELNNGWSVVKRLLQHERQSQTSARSNAGPETESLQDKAKRYVGTTAEGKLADADLRSRIAQNLMDTHAHKLTIARIAAEAQGKVEVSAAASILKNSNTRNEQTKSELQLEIMGTQGLGWDGDDFAQDEKDEVLKWLFGKAMSIYGGSYEIQNNIISKNILGLPETTQKN